MTTALFIDWARIKLSVDGSDSYIMGAVELARKSDDPVWYAGCFTTPYAPPSSELLFAHWPRRDVLNRPDALLQWVTANWSALPISGARLTNAMGPRKFVQTLVGYARWIDGGGVRGLDRDDFDGAFTALLASVPNHGRYTGLKLYETLRRVGVAAPPVSDIRPRGGRTPRRTLAHLFGHDHRSDTAALVVEANALADELRQQIPTTWFNVEMLLCNFHQALAGKFYPGYALDKELSRIAIVEAAFPGAANGTRGVRQRLYRSETLGELGGWSGVRKELGRVMPRYGYIWHDALFDYGATADLSSPVVRVGDKPALTALRGIGEE